ncbi:hypothetical protein NUSPORA_01643 [Nucleospora cyclopteri]
MLLFSFFSLAFFFEIGKLKKVIIITRNNCRWSQKMRDLLVRQNIPYLDLNEDILDADIKAITNYPGFTYPSVFLHGKFIGGFENAEIHPYFNKKQGPYDLEMNKLLNSLLIFNY